jgi:hypothetical protein
MSKQIIEAVNESWENEGGSLAVLPPERPIEATLFLTEFYAVDGRALQRSARQLGVPSSRRRMKARELL